jgi:catechol 2,3-dioxygenase-like lactoylglutathione lyase family enzyme
MIGYVTLGTNDFDRATVFYDALLAGMGAKRFEETDRFVYYGKRPGLGMLAIMKPYNGEPATVGNGVMVALGLRNRAAVDDMHQLALALGAADEGAPGPRGEGFYGAYFRDLDGNKLCVFTYEGRYLQPQ